MPLYDFECNCGNQFDMVLSMSECDKPQSCPACDGRAHKIIALGHGGIRRTGDGLPWVRSLNKVLTDENGNHTNLETVQDYRNYLAANPNVRPKEDHPALPSSYGDALYSKPDPAEVKRRRNKAGYEHLRKMRKIEVSGRATP